MSPSPTPAPRAARSSVSRRVLVVVLVVVVAVVGLGAGLALAGGLDRDASGVGTRRTVVAGERVPTGAFDLTVTSWATTDTLDPEPLAEAGADAWLVVFLDVLDTDTVTRNLNAAAVTLPADLPGDLELVGDATPTRAETTTLVRDGSQFPAFQPGLAEQVLLAWPVRGDAGGEPELDVSLPVYVYRDMYIGGGRRWAETGETVGVLVPYGDVPTVHDPALPVDDPWDESPADDGGGT